MSFCAIAAPPACSLSRCARLSCHQTIDDAMAKCKYKYLPLCFMAHAGSLYVLYVPGCQGNDPEGSIISPILQEAGVQQNRVRELWKQGKPAVQGWCSTGNPYIAEMMGHAGFDAVVIDWQHGVGVSQESVVACIQALGSSTAVPIVRLPRNSPE